MILTADLHITDIFSENYRWEIFKHLQRYGDGHIYILGDICDRADKHPGTLVNRLVTELLTLAEGNEVTIIAGNHDRSPKGDFFWNFLNETNGIKFITKPTFDKDLLLLPFSVNPIEEWKDINFNNYKAAFIHQTVNGATLRDGITATIDNLPLFPQSLKIYAGDLHIPHTIGNVTYVGSPHPVKFGDNYPTRILQLDKHFEIKREINIPTIKKNVIELYNLEELDVLDTVEGDQIKIKCNIPASKMDQWPVEQAAISAWAKNRGVTLASVEAIIGTSPTDVDPLKFAFDSAPEHVLEAFCRAEGVEDAIYQTGLQLLKTVKN